MNNPSIPALPDLVAFLQSVRDFEDEHGAPMSVDIDRWCAVLSAQPISAIPPGYAVPDGWKEAIRSTRESLEYDTPSSFDNQAFRNYANAVLDSLEESLSLLASAPAIQTQTSTKPTEQEKDAARWQEARKYLSIEDIEAWHSREWKGHEPSEFESAKADAAIDAAMQSKATDERE